MKPLARFAAAACLAVLVPSSGLAAEPRVDRVEILGAGIYTVVRTQKQESNNLPGGGLTILKDFKLTKATDIIPCKLGTTFGISYKVIGEPEGATVALTLFTVFPKEGVRDPEQKKVYYQSEYTVNKVLGKQTYKSYTFDHDWELVPGEWAFEVRQGDRLLLRQKFTVVKE